MSDVPHLRFPEFSGEWEKCKVSDLLDFYSTNSLSWEQLEYDTNTVMNLHYGLIHVGLPTMVDLAKDKLPNIKKENMPKNFELCKEGDVAFADASEDTNEVAKTIEFYNLAMLYRKNINWFLEEESEKEQSTTLKYALELLRKTDEKHQKAVAYAIIGFLKNGDLLEDAAK